MTIRLSHLMNAADAISNIRVSIRNGCSKIGKSTGAVITTPASNNIILQLHSAVHRLLSGEQ